jgi:hypothetical protein
MRPGRCGIESYIKDIGSLRVTEDERSDRLTRVVGSSTGSRTTTFEETFERSESHFGLLGAIRLTEYFRRKSPRRA